MEHDPRQSIHEIGVARQLILSSAKPAVVDIGSFGRSATISQLETVQEEVDHEANQEVAQTEDFSMAGSGAPRVNIRPRLVFRADEDRWSTFANPACLHDRHCGHQHQPRPRILLKPVGAEGEPAERAFETPNRPLGTRPLQVGTRSGTRSPFPRAAIPRSHSHTSDLDSLLCEPGGDMESENSTGFPSRIGPFLLESQSSGGGSIAEAFATSDSELTPTATPTASRKKTVQAFHKAYYASRTKDWIVNIPADVTTAPGHAPPFTTIQNSYSATPENMANSHRGRHQEDSAIRGNFIPFSKSFKERSPSPRREQGPHRVYKLQLSLTESQMDRLTAVLSPEDNMEPLPRGRARNADHDADMVNKIAKENAAPRMRSRSPAKTYQSTTTPRARSRSPVKFNLFNTPESQRTLQGFRANTTTSASSSSKAPEARFERSTPKSYATPTRASGRGERVPPAPIDTDLARAHARMAAMRVGKQPTVVVHNPPERTPSPVRQPSQYPIVDDSSSHYSQDSAEEPYPSCVSPLRIQKDYEPKHMSILQEYTDQKNSARGSDKGSEEPEQLGTPDEPASGAELAYTPLAPFLPKGALTVRKASKTLIGEGGWLEKTSKPEQPTAGSPTRTGGFLGNLLKKAKDMIEANQDNRAQRKSRESDKSRPTSRQLAISLSPREQSLLYCELEFALTTALADYMTAQFHAGRLEADKLKKVAEDWQRKGRPKVVGFRYDMETQLDLVRAHAHDFKFYSRVAATTAILGILDTAKANARALRVRTFCQPDTVIAKQLLDSQGLFNILGCPEDQQIKLAEIVAFFKAAIERRRIHSLHELHQQHQQQQQQQQSGAMAASSTTSAVAVPVVMSAATSPLRNSRSPRPGDEWWGTAPAQGQLRGSNNNSHGGAAKMDPAGYDSQGE
ncbi:hypothetical protein C8A00DRAFT_47392 [Chaetomidium leptoderma]|uniref:Uncharacterized protein n=1 Tax=Chaetomidium leptoderma TaxID=669021 RepID=A0AAN6VE73_9PEZI|nr:hypothetical protein C8A00DRAFT_47392 [Chaetomidium leptoderma]